MSAMLVVMLLASTTATLLVVALAFGGPAVPPPMASVSGPFLNVDRSQLPNPKRFATRDQTVLAYREYTPAGGPAHGTVVLVHGSSGDSSTLHVLAATLTRAGHRVIVPDVRGHGESGSRGRIDYLGQLEDDLEDLRRSVAMSSPVTLAGFSAGAGFALRFAGSRRQGLFSSYLLLAPFVSPSAPTYRPRGGGWVRVGVPRLAAVAVCKALGLHLFNHLPVIRFALCERGRTQLTPGYALDLLNNFRPQADYTANIRAVQRPMEVLAGRDDEVFHADRFTDVFQQSSHTIPVTLIPNTDHVGLTTTGIGVEACLAALSRLHQAARERKSA